MAGFAAVLFGAVLVRCAEVFRLCFKAACSHHSFGSAAVRKRTASRCSLAKSGTSLRLVPYMLRIV